MTQGYPCKRQVHSTMGRIMIAANGHQLRHCLQLLPLRGAGYVACGSIIVKCIAQQDGLRGPCRADILCQPVQGIFSVKRWQQTAPRRAKRADLPRCRSATTKAPCSGHHNAPVGRAVKLAPAKLKSYPIMPAPHLPACARLPHPAGVHGPAREWARAPLPASTARQGA